MFLYLFLIGEILGAFPQAPIIANQPGPQFLSIWVNDTIEEERKLFVDEIFGYFDTFLVFLG